MKRVGIDIGGTFTDLVWFDDASQEVGKAKTLSTPDPLDGLSGAIAAAELDPADIGLFLHATTIVTNLVLERKGAVVGLVSTRGFRDLLEIGSGLKPNPYDVQWSPVEPLVPRWLRLEVGERTLATGEITRAPDRDEIAAVLDDLVAQGCDAVAICLLNAYANPENELLVEAVARERHPQLRISRSSEIDPRMREYARASTTVVNAYALPAFSSYAERLRDGLGLDTEVRFMQSSGGVVGVDEAAKAPVNLVYSGPAGGVLGARRLGRAAGVPHLITLDVGGTSSDVCVIRDQEAGDRDELELEFGIPIRTQTLDISAIGAGGGSIAHVDAGGALAVGPESARSTPGPASYGLGGTRPTVTDANLVLGLLREDSLLGRSGIRLDRSKAIAALEPLAEHFGLSVTETARGVYRTVNANMAQAIREITVFQGIDPREHALVAFGGCGPQHAAEVARDVGMRDVIVPWMPSVFSALGLLGASLAKSESRTLLVPLDEHGLADAGAVLEELEARASASLQDDPVVQEIVITRVGYLRYVGQSHELPVPLTTFEADAIRTAFEDAHEHRYSTRLGDPVELVDLRVTAIGVVAEPPPPAWTGGRADPTPVAMAETADGPTPVFGRDDLAAGVVLVGPALIEEADSTTFVPTDAEAVIDEHANIRITLT
ncbi:MAG: hydantoinase/oxoprolinase family protein [Solirubrobacteraceae bacterium]